jgi:hypothetical protein
MRFQPEVPRSDVESTTSNVWELKGHRAQYACGRWASSGTAVARSSPVGYGLVGVPGSLVGEHKEADHARAPALGYRPSERSSHVCVAHLRPPACARLRRTDVSCVALALIHGPGSVRVFGIAGDLGVSVGRVGSVRPAAGLLAIARRGLLGWPRGRRVLHVDGQSGESGGGPVAASSRCQGCCHGQCSGRCRVMPRAWWATRPARLIRCRRMVAARAVA